MSTRTTEASPPTVAHELDAYLAGEFQRAQASTDTGFREITARTIAMAVKDLRADEVDRALRLTEMVLELEK